MNTNIIKMCLIGCLLSLGISAQPPLSIDEWEDFESWSVTKPGELKLKNTELKNQRIIFDGIFPGPGGQTRPTTMIMDITNVFFQGKPAVWIQWTSTSSENDKQGTASLDLIVVEKQTFRTLFRIADGPGIRQWAGNYNITHYGPEQITNIFTKDDGTTETKTLRPETDVFEFATFQFLLPFLDLKDGAKYRLPGFQRTSHRYQLIPVRIGGKTGIRDAHGKKHEVWEAQVISADRSTLITFYLTQKAPYFYGWKYERVSDRKILTSMTFREWYPL